eukprot:CAMPEP_0172421812 /NCGR_PEP_ID=MMETSP1064-20121228/8037_1 /TAXON_ID=202472 /ORGANISM="Aulacoseira subarctica , Strain CCAP 1002/5" /LENGTH=458 /DNA_ID=CAMNT_0013162389 /DNA_START=128 /DNA_END=1500 /DNA_ORIENTATION=-
MITTTRLPTYSVERYYMLSELQQHASSLQYLQPQNNSMVSASVPALPTQDESTTSTSATTTSSSLDSSSAPPETMSSPSPLKLQPSQHVILYILWNPLQHPMKEILDIIEDAILHIKSQEPPTTTTSNTTVTAATPCNMVQTDHTASTADMINLVPSYQTTPTTNTGVKVHLVVERIRPIQSSIPQQQRTTANNESAASYKDEINNNYLLGNASEVSTTTLYKSESNDYDLGIDERQQIQAQEEIEGSYSSCYVTKDENAETPRTISSEDWLSYHHKMDQRAVEQFCRTVAKSPIIRSHVDGVTIGFTNEVRAAPGLEAVLSAVTHRARDRRTFVKVMGDSAVIDDPTKSNITVVTTCPEIFIGLDTSGETDAAQGLMQSLTRIEWNGNGDYMSFASRAHCQWKEYHGVADEIYVPDAADFAATIMVVAFLAVALFAYLVQCYSKTVSNNGNVFEKFA